MANADILLDTQIAASAGDISDIQAEVDQVETGAGLDTDGAYVANSGSNYLDLASSLAAADLLLDTQIGTNEADIAQEISTTGPTPTPTYRPNDERRYPTYDQVETGAGRTPTVPWQIREPDYRRYLRYEQRN